MIASLLSFVSIVLSVMPVSGASSQCTDTAYTRNRDLVYVWLGLGHGSFHLSYSGESYINYENGPSSWKTDDGKKFPDRKPFVDPKFDFGNRTFSGSIHWNEPSTVYGGRVRFDIIFTFSQDWSTIIDGVNVGTFKNGAKNEFKYLGYNRYVNTTWDYISDGQKFYQVATNSATDRVWGSPHMGKIAEYNPNLGRWIEDKTMPESARRLAVDSNGRPAMT